MAGKVFRVHGKFEENQPRVKATNTFCGTFPGFPLSASNPHPKRVLKILTHLNLLSFARQLKAAEVDQFSEVARNDIGCSGYCFSGSSQSPATVEVAEYLQTPPEVGSIKEDRCFPYRFGDSLGRQDVSRVVDAPLKKGVQITVRRSFPSCPGGDLPMRQDLNLSLSASG